MHFNSQRNEYQTSFSIISLVKSLPHPTENDAMFLSDLNNTIVEKTPEADVTQLEEIGIVLHEFLIADKSQGRAKSSEGMLAQEESLLSPEQDDKSASAFHALSNSHWGEDLQNTTE
jgi:hypothetical protein